MELLVQVLLSNTIDISKTKMVKTLGSIEILLLRKLLSRIKETIIFLRTFNKSLKISELLQF